ncbi:MAG: hypothetical protein ACI90V_009962 [Bacillariaceae sp.]|jgi:hypothetical protein
MKEENNKNPLSINTIREERKEKVEINRIIKKER